LDPGDWVAANECYTGSSAENSSWHGTHVTVVLEGGYDSSYNTNSGYTTMNGIITLATGSLTLKNLIIE